MDTKAREFGGSIKQQVSRLGHEAGVFSAVIYYNPVSERFDGAAFVPKGHDVPDVNRLLGVLLNGTEPIVLQHPARSSSSEPRTGTLLQDGNATATSEDRNVIVRRRDPQTMQGFTRLMGAAKGYVLTSPSAVKAIQTVLFTLVWGACKMPPVSVKPVRSATRTVPPNNGAFWLLAMQPGAQSQA
ncbi:hypothetical protein CLIM01_14159 [Colletotrichum limetticola]|uniref:Uncharacterized protein n=1 Tax=Colletotrichum limetticola TaxID=1209924 RepID=A0ABQ9PBH4_9PEZI|nr:hypothetical protein CLIM01_14159 [Colletotrichum limetticola]